MYANDFPAVSWTSNPSIPVPSGDAETWILDRARELGGETWVLAFSVDGVTWGKVKNESLSDSGEAFSAFSPKLSNFRLLREIYVFSNSGQAHAWKEGSLWKAAEIIDGQGESSNYIDQALLLLGTTVEDSSNGFFLLKEGAQGLHHAIPLEKAPRSQADRTGAPRLIARCYLGRDEQNGAAYIAATRLVRIEESKELK